MLAEISRLMILLNMVSLILKTSSFLYLHHFVLKPKPRTFLKVLQSNTFKIVTQSVTIAAANLQFVLC
jgi:hypothetical protein